MKFCLILSFSSILLSCGNIKNQNGVDGKNGIDGKMGNSGSNAISLVSTSIPATAQQCPTGGSLILISQDTLGTGVWDATDKPETSFLSCNGLAGGVGQVGATGSIGASGKDGVSLISRTLSAGSACPNNGFIVEIAQDKNNNGVWDDTDIVKSSFMVCNGSNGQSIVGPQGLPGVNTTPIVPVEFCKGITPTYPSTFPEYGFNINGTIWAVYSANGGFLTKLTPGNYSSDGINASCNFNVSANGTVTDY